MMLNIDDVKILAKRRGVKLKEIAQQLGYSYSGFYRAVVNDTLRLKSRVLMAKILNISVKELIDLNEHESFGEEELWDEYNELERKKRDAPLVYTKEMFEQQQKIIDSLNEILDFYKAEYEALKGKNINSKIKDR